MSRNPEWFETFFDGLYEQVLGSETLEQAAGESAKTIRRALKLRKGMRVLDCPCGLGRISFQLARLGMDVTGVDLTASYIRKARLRAKKEKADIRFQQCDMRELPFESEFDAVINWFSSFGYCDEAGNLAAARAAFTALKPGGKFMLELMNKSFILSHFKQEMETCTAEGIRIINRPKFDNRTSYIRDEWVMSKGQKKERRKMAMRIYNGADIRKVLKSAGFKDIQLLGHVPTGKFTRYTRRFLAVATKDLN